MRKLIMYWSTEDNAFVVEVPELPGCMAHGSTQAEALDNINDVMRLWMDVAREHGYPIPEPMCHRLMYA